MGRIAGIAALSLAACFGVARADEPAAPAPAPGAKAADPEAAAEARTLFERGEVLREEHRWAEAGQAYGRSLDRDESAFLTHLRYQEVVVASGDAASLAAEYDEVVRKRPADPAARLHLLRLQAPAPRLEALLPLLKASPQDPLLLLEAGRARLAAGDAAAARRDLEAAWALDPSLGDVLSLSVEALRRSGDAAGARARLEAVLKRSPEHHEAALHLARLDLVEGKAKEALDRATAVLAMRPTAVSAMLVKAEASGRLGKTEDALQSLEAALRVNPEVPSALVATADVRARSATREGLDAAIALYRKALAMRGVEAGHAWFGLGWAHERAGQYKEAGDAYRAAAEFAPGDATVVNSIGVIAMKQKSFETARLQFRKAIDLDPKSPEAYLNLAALSEQQQDWNEAIKQYQKVLSMKGQESNVRALLNSAFDHEALSQFKRAEELLVRVRQIRPDDSEAATFHGDNLFFQKKWKPAIRAYQDAVKIDEKNRFAWRGLGLGLAKEDKADDAIEALEKAKALKADDPPTLLVLGDLYLTEKDDLQKALDNYEAYVKAGGGDPDVPVLIEQLKKDLGG